MTYWYQQHLVCKPAAMEKALRFFAFWILKDRTASCCKIIFSTVNLKKGLFFFNKRHSSRGNNF